MRSRAAKKTQNNFRFDALDEHGKFWPADSFCISWISPTRVLLDVSIS